MNSSALNHGPVCGSFGKFFLESENYNWANDKNSKSSSSPWKSFWIKSDAKNCSTDYWGSFKSNSRTSEKSQHQNRSFFNIFWSRTVSKISKPPKNFRIFIRFFTKFSFFFETAKETFENSFPKSRAIEKVPTLCPVTGKPARYRTRDGIPYYDSYAYKVLIERQKSSNPILKPKQTLKPTA